MEGIVILALIGGAIGFLAYRARDKVGYRDLATDLRGEADLPRRPVSPGFSTRLNNPGTDLLDDRTGDAGARPRL